MSRSDQQPPHLSIVVTGRNDNFGGDFNERFIRALRFNHEQLTLAGVTHELVLVEWAPLPGKALLAEVVEEACPSLVPDSLVSFVVDPAYHDAVSLNPRLAFQEFIAKNVGIRRARGSFVLTTNTDIYLGRRVIELLGAGSLEPAVLYRATRIDLRSGLDATSLDWNMLEESRNIEVVNEMRPPCFTNASGDFLLMDRQTYHHLRGFNEVYRVAKIHIDGNFCVKAYSTGVPIRDIGGPVYHLGQGTLFAQHPAYRSRPELAPWGDIRWKADVIYENPPDWGLGGAPMRGIRPGVHYLEFDWAAVAPMLELRRVLLPAARVGVPSR